jgi:UrcA family protein
MFRFALLSLAAAAIATPVLAQSAITVGYADLNLQSRSGAKVMVARINAAAHRACGPAPIIRDLRRSQEYSDCVDETVSQAVTALNAPLVTAAYGGTDAMNRTVATAGEPR